MADLMGWAKVMLARRAEAREEARREKELAREEALRREQFAIQREGLAEQRRAAQAQEQRLAEMFGFQKEQAAQGREQQKLNMLLGGLVEPTEQAMNIPFPEGQPDYLQDVLPKPPQFRVPGPSFDFGGGMEISPISPEEQFRRRAGMEREAKMADIGALREDASQALEEFFQSPYAKDVPQHQRQALAVQMRLGQALPEDTLYSIAKASLFDPDPDTKAKYGKIMDRLERYQAVRTMIPSPSFNRVTKIDRVASTLYKEAITELGAEGKTTPTDQEIFQKMQKRAMFIKDPEERALIMEALAKAQRALVNERPSPANPLWDLFGGTPQE